MSLSLYMQNASDLDVPSSSAVPKMATANSANNTNQQRVLAAPSFAPANASNATTATANAASSGENGELVDFRSFSFPPLDPPAAITMAKVGCTDSLTMHPCVPNAPLLP